MSRRNTITSFTSSCTLVTGRLAHPLDRWTGSGFYRQLSVLAWGSNANGQCGSTSLEHIIEPAEVQELAHLGEVVGVSAGRSHSACIFQDGRVATFGCGAGGKLGHKGGASLSVPRIIQSLVPPAEDGKGSGRRVTAAALGDSHSLFLAGDGAALSCGENKEGQCGIGTSLEMLAEQRRLEWTAQEQLAAKATKAGGNPHATQPGHARLGYGQIGTPTVIRRSASMHEVVEHLEVPVEEGDEGGPSTKQYADVEGLGKRPVVAAAASRYFSALVTSDGCVWTFGGGFNGELGHGATWCPSPRQVEGQVRELIEEGGGACQVATAGAATLAILSDGRCVKWGRLSSQDQPTQPTVVGLPDGTRATQVVAGQRHALITDGEGVWFVGTGAEGMAPDRPSTLPCEDPLRIDLPGVSFGIAAIAAGGHMSAVVDGEGQLWMWGYGEITNSPILGPTPRQIVGPLSGRRVKDVAVGGLHVLAIVD